MSGQDKERKMKEQLVSLEVQKNENLEKHVGRNKGETKTAHKKEIDGMAS